jgi:hypothetical protein
MGKKAEKRAEKALQKDAPVLGKLSMVRSESGCPPSGGLVEVASQKGSMLTWSYRVTVKTDWVPGPFAQPGGIQAPD